MTWFLFFSVFVLSVSFHLWMSVQASFISIFFLLSSPFSSGLHPYWFQLSPVSFQKKIFLTLNITVLTEKNSQLPQHQLFEKIGDCLLRVVSHYLIYRLKTWEIFSHLPCTSNLSSEILAWYFAYCRLCPFAEPLPVMLQSCSFFLRSLIQIFSHVLSAWLTFGFSLVCLTYSN